MHVQGSLQGVGVLSIRVGSAPKGAVAPAQSGVVRLQMIRMNGSFGEVGWSMGMFGLGRLIVRAFGTALMPWAALVLDAHATAFRQRPAGTAPLSGSRRLGTEIKQGVAIAALPVGEKGRVLGPPHIRGNRFHDLLKQHGVFATALLVHQKPARPFQDDGRPAGRVRRGDPLADHRVDLVPFKRQPNEGLAQTVEHQRGFHPAQPAFPLGNRVLLGSQNPRRRPQPHLFPAQPQRGRHLADGGLDALHRRARRLREDLPTGRTCTKTSDSVVNRLVATVTCGVTGTAGWTNQRRWRLHRSSKTRQTIGCKGKSIGLSAVPR